MKRNLVAILLVVMVSAGMLGAQIMPGLKTGNITCGADRTGEYLDLLKTARVGVVANPSSRCGDLHLVDFLLRSGIKVSRVFAPEHGFRGEAEAGEVIRDGKDTKTGLPVVSLYGNHKKPTPEDLAGLDWMVFDIQDVGVRFYTYISTLHYVMEACAENSVPLLVLDRPNPNGFYVDGPVLDTVFRSFVGMHPVPVVHGMTIGEYARMINGEGWLKSGIACRLIVIPCMGYDHQTEYVLPVKPSPNLPNQVSVYLYPGLCFFEGTIVSIGRGTEFPFQVYGHPDMKSNFSFIPASIPGVVQRPPYEGEKCFGTDLRLTGIQEIAFRHGIVLDWLLGAYDELGRKDSFFTSYFNTLAGTDKLRQQISCGIPPVEIRRSWKKGLERFKKIRIKYLLYPDVDN
ncbi:MAG: DUF1343 domain-containing protein [Bacteroidota bacterium]